MPRERPPPPWRVVESSYPLSTPWFRARQDQVVTHLGERIIYTYQEHPGSVLVVAVTHAGQVVLLRQYRHPVRRWCWELPAGRLREGVPARRTAREELREEAGGEADEWRRVGAFYASTGSSSERSEVYLATGVSLGAHHPERTELLRMVPVPWRRALWMAQTGRIPDGPSALALLMCRRHLRTLGPRA
ncbi:MAG TPA: NUDIX hydrolase [Longimicrobiaceae bacterium]|nr:NUDIX hydrolase [Longimicrobiaceae bacterium]